MKAYPYRNREELIEAVAEVTKEICSRTAEDVCGEYHNCTQCIADRGQKVTKLLTGAEIENPHIQMSEFKCDGTEDRCNDVGCHQHVVETLLKNATLRYEIQSDERNPMAIMMLYEDPAGYLYTHTTRSSVPSCTDCYFIARDNNEHPCNKCSTINNTMSRDYYITQEEGSMLYYDHI